MGQKSEFQVDDCFESLYGCGCRILDIKENSIILVDYCEREWIIDKYHVRPQIVRMHIFYKLNEFITIFGKWREIPLKKWNRLKNKEITIFYNT